MSRGDGGAARAKNILRTALLALVALVAFAAPVEAAARALPARASAVALDLHEDRVSVELGMPLDQLGLALDLAVDDPDELLLAHEEFLRAYLGRHVGATTPTGEPFAVSVGTLAVRRVDGAERLVARLELDPPPGADTRAFTLRCDPILHTVATHRLFVSIRRDFATAVFSDDPAPAGVLCHRHEALAIDRQDGSFWRGTRAITMQGVRHIAEGTDHLLFILVLLLPAPLRARGGRWRRGSSLRRAALRNLKVITAFTLGHSIALALAVFGWVPLPAAPVAVLVALSILASAVHAIRPLFPGHKPRVVVAFGVVHGLAFATALTDLGYGGTTLLASLLAFNLGIEVMQLAVVATVVPWLILLRNSPVYRPLRWLVAGFAGLAAAGWAVERTLGFVNPMQPAVDLVFDHAVLVITALATLSLIVLARDLFARTSGQALQPGA